MKKVIQWLDQKFEWTIMCILLLCITLTLSAQIFCRYILSSSMAWPEEFSRYCFVVTGMFAIPFCIRRETMLRVDILMGLFTEKVKNYLFLISDICSLCLWCYLWINSFTVAKGSFNPVVYSTSMTWFPLSIIYCIPVFTLLLAVFRQIQMIILRLIKMKAMRKEEIGA